MSADTPFRVLALDGGGMRGYFTVRLLARLVEHAGGDPAHADLGRAFALIAGTSTGSLIAATLAAGVPLARVAALFREHGPAIFPHPAPYGGKSLAWCARHWRVPSARASALRGVLESLFGTTTLGELYAQRTIALCVPVTDLRGACGHVLATPHRAGGADAVTLVDACMASCAAPMLLPPLTVAGAGIADALWCDGGLWATSPLLFSLAEALAIAPEGRPIEIVVAGTCAMPVPASVTKHPPGHGIGLWIRGLRAVQVTGDAQARGAADIAMRILPALRRPVRIIRLREPVPTDNDATVVRLDNASPRALAAMERLADEAAALNAVDDATPGTDAACLAAILGSVVPAPAPASAPAPG